ncbi:MAG: aspartate aminotransferase family protein [Actinobacteria bacterium]|nr:aspartate aminotransferase family protein [Actinomycetota bacterium]MCB9412363.1 aspartate aminotransferase family protein [Actinomycetota bacterium]
MTLPTDGADAASIAAALQAYREDDAPTTGGRVLAYVYDSGIADLEAVGNAALTAFSGVNALDPTVFPSVARIENDLVGWGLDLLAGGPAAVGVVTSGGTESCMLAVKAAREQWRADHPDSPRRPTVIMPITAHSAFVKATELLDVDRVMLPVDPTTFQVRTSDVAAALDEAGSDAALVVLSAPSYAHGVIDPIEDIAPIAAERGVPVHVDACIGGWILPFLSQLGYQVPPFDFRVPGVRSMSVDLHKYAYAPKGTSLLLFSDPEYRLNSYFAYSDWPGYPVVNTTLQSTKSAGPMAAAWAVCRRIGLDGYRELVLATRRATDAIIAAVDEIDGLRVLGQPASTLIALAADGPDGVDPFLLADAMSARGWFIQAQPGVAGLPRTAHLTVQATTLGGIDEFCEALRSAAAEAAQQPWAAADPQLEAAAMALDPSTLDLATVDALLKFAGLDAGESPGLPAEAAGIQALLEALPTQLRDTLLAGYFSAIFQPSREPAGDS